MISSSAPAARRAGAQKPPVARGSVAIVPPRFGPGVIGGAESVLAEVAHGLAGRGVPIEILTTCARDHFTWANEFEPGVSELDHGGVLRRFPAEPAPSSIRADRDRIGNRILAGESVTIQDQQRWINAELRCSGLWHHVFDHGHRYRTLIFAPYMFWTTFAVSQIHSRRSIVMPCLHDEPPAYLDIYRAMLEGAGALWFLTEPEHDLAARICSLPHRAAVVGAPVRAPDRYDAERFRVKYGIDQPFVYFAGRREWGKGWMELLAGYAEFCHRRRGRRDRGPDGPAAGAPLKLVTSGVGAVEPPLGCEREVIDLGLISDEDRDDAMAAASAYVQPSAMESFSRTVLESMLAGTPVIANGASAVVAWHLERSGAGLVYHSRSELSACLDFVADRPQAAGALAGDGARRYVVENYDPDTVFGSMVDTLDRWFPLDSEPVIGAATTDVPVVTGSVR